MALPKGLNDGLAVFTQEETKLVRASATLFDFDLLPGFRYILVSPSLGFGRLTVPVYEGEKRIGAASLFGYGQKVLALMSFDYFTPERFDLSIGRPVYAVPRGDYHFDPRSESGYLVDFIDIEGIDLTYDKPPIGQGSPIVLTTYEAQE